MQKQFYVVVELEKRRDGSLRAETHVGQITR